MALVLALVLSACGGGSSATGAAGGASGTDPGNVAGAEAATVADDSTPKSGGTINYAHEQETPCLTGGWVQEAFIERQYADELVSQTKTGKIVPWLATSWKTSQGRPDLDLPPEAGRQIHQRRTARRESRGRQLRTTGLDPETLQRRPPYLARILQVGESRQPTTFQLTLSKPYAPLLPVDLAGLLRDPLAEHLRGPGGSDLQRTDRQRPVHRREVDPRPEHHLQPNTNYNSAPANAAATRARPTPKS